MDNLKTLTEYMLWVTITNDLFMVEKHKNLKGNKIFLVSQPIGDLFESLPWMLGCDWSSVW